MDAPQVPAGGRPRVAVLGPGGIGGLLAGLHARAGHEVVCIARQATADHLNRHGIEVRSPRFGDFTVPVRATTRLETPVDLCYVAVKATMLQDAIGELPAAAVGDALVVPFLNGIDHVAWLRKRYPADQVVAGTIRIESARVSPGVIEQPSRFAAVELANGRAGPARVSELRDWLVGLGMDVEVRDDELRMLWSKLAVLAPIALLGTHENAPMGVVRERRLDDFEAVAAEIAAAAKAADGVELDSMMPVKILESAGPTMRSSMQRDAEAGNPPELDAIGGTILRAAARGGIEAPVTARLVAEIEARTVRS